MSLLFLVILPLSPSLDWWRAAGPIEGYPTSENLVV